MADSEEKREYHGHAVINGVPQFFSVSSLERADIRSGGCLRKWWYRYVGRIKDKESDSKTAGIKLHAELANYLRTGNRMLSALATRGLFMVPDPGPDLLVEQSIGGPKAPYLTADGIPLIGFIDCAHDRLTNKGASDVGDVQDPPGTIELLDWKWKKDGSKAEYFLEPAELVKSIQMAGYGVFAGNAFPNKTHVRLSHGYFPLTRGQPRKVTRLHVIDDCRRSWEYVDTVARTVRDVAREQSAEAVPGNRHSCDKYGGCIHKSYCTAYQKNVENYTMSALFGETEAKELAMGLISTLPNNLQAQPAPQPQPDMRQQLAAEEAQQRTQATQTSVGMLPGFAESWAAIERGGRGYPALGGAAAQMRAALVGQSVAPGSALAGAGELGGIMMVDPAHVVQLGNEFLAAERAKQTQQPVVQLQLQQQPAPQVQHVQHNTQAMNFLPPDAPMSNPALAAKPLEQPPQQLVQQPLHNGNGPVAIIQPLQTMQQLQPQPAPLQPQIQNVAAAAAPKKRGRRTKAEIEAANAAAAPAGQTAQPAAPAITPPAVLDNDAADMEVFVDCIPNCEYESLHPYVDGITKALVSRFCPAGSLQDVRCAPKDGPLGFGGWRGAVNAIVRELPPPDACYYLDTRSNEIAAEVADAMRAVCESKNALYVKGVR